MVWECQACSYIFDENSIDSASGVAPGTRFQDIPEEWKCPVCGVGPEFFEELAGRNNK